MPPPAKRRRGLAGSIVSTALSAALIGTAVGLTVYRLWRDRGKQAERIQQPPPPPYEWTPDREERQAAPPLQITPATPRNTRKSRHPVASSSKRPVSQRRTPRTRALPHAVHATPALLPAPALFPPPQPEFNFEPEPVEPTIVEEQMDWIGDKLSVLIEEGKKALNREVVVMSDAQEDEVDDGSGAWEEEEQEEEEKTSISRSSSLRRGSVSRRPRSLAPQHGYVPQQLQTPSPSPRKAGFEFDTLSYSSSAPSLALRGTPTHTRGISAESLNVTPSTSFREDERTWESPEMKELMERARAKLLRSRGTSG